MTLLYKYRNNTTLAGRIDVTDIGKFGNLSVSEAINADIAPYFLVPDNNFFYLYIYKWSINILINDFVDNPKYDVYNGYPMKKRVGQYTVRRGNATINQTFINYQETSTPAYSCFQDSASSGRDIINNISTASSDTVVGGVSIFSQSFAGGSFIESPTATDFTYNFEAIPNADMAINYLAILTYFNRIYPNGSNKYNDFVLINL